VGFHQSRTTQRRPGENRRNVRPLVLGAVAFVLLTGSSCGGDEEYAGLTRGDAIRAATAKVMHRYDSAKRGYYEGSISNVTTLRGVTDSRKPVWFVGLWNGQALKGDCALVSRSQEANGVQVVPCAGFAKYGNQGPP
jgi:hypothetical protein